MSQPKRSEAAVTPLPGFEHLQRFRDPSLDRETVRISPGEYYITCADEVITTVLGSCVSACIRDPVAGVSGMNHFMLPETDRKPDWGPQISAATRYGSYAMEQLINGLLSRGARRERLEAKLFGGARVLVGASDVGAGNADFAIDYLAAEGIGVAASDLQGERGRRVVYFTDTGRARVRLLGLQGRQDIKAAEEKYRSRLTNKPVSGDIELFD